MRFKCKPAWYPAFVLACARCEGADTKRVGSSDIAIPTVPLEETLGHTEIRNRATTADIQYKGNTGGGTYGSNIVLSDESCFSSQDFAIHFSSASSLDQVCSCWLKIGPDGGVNGFFKGNQALDFPLLAHGSQALAIEANTQGGCACGNGGVPTTNFGLFASTWLEFDMSNVVNEGWSGADASCLVSARYGLDIPALEVCFEGKCSTVRAGGTGTNAYLAGMEGEDGIGLNIPPGKKVHLQVTVGTAV